MDYHLRQLERLFRVTESPEIGAQLINIYLRRGDAFLDIKHLFPAGLLWDTCMGYEPGKTSKLVTSISIRLDLLGWKVEPPKTMIIGDRDQAFFRTVWDSLEIPFLMDGWRLPGEQQALVFEDVPILHLEPTLSIDKIKVAGSGGRNSSVFSCTKRVAVMDATEALAAIEECAYNIFHGALSGPEQERYSGSGIYSAEQQKCEPE